MASVELPIEEPEKFKIALMKKYSMEVPIFLWKDKIFLRYSFNVYNSQQDAELLVYALRKLV